MIRNQNFINDRPKLYLVGTPIGNLEDITFRALNTLKSVDICFAEDTRVTKVLFDYYQIDTKLLVYQKFNEDSGALKIIEFLRDGKNVALVSDAGNPIISDPGYTVTKMVLQEGFDVVPISGVSAFTSALMASSLSAVNFSFYGFLDSKESKRKKELEALKTKKETLIFYEAPHRIKEMLTDMLDVLGDRYICLARELTKKFEEFIRGNISEIIPLCDSLKGEMVIVCEGANENDMYSDLDPISQIDDLILAGMVKNEAIKTVAKRMNLDKNELYKKYNNK